MAKKPKLNSYEIPEGKRRRGSFIVRLAIRRVSLHQHRDALKSASRMVLALPVIQGILLVGIFNAEYWMLLLGLEGLVIAWLAASQLSRPNPESKLIGFGVALMNALVLGAVGIFLSSHIYWVTGIIGMIPVVWLVFAATGKRTVRLAWVLFVVPLLALLMAAGVARYDLELSKTETDPAKRATELQVVWLAFQVRGGNGSERALLRLRQAQTAFELERYDEAFEYANDGVFMRGSYMRGIPQSVIGQDLLDSLLRLKAQSYYNNRWQKNERIDMIIGPEPLDPETLSEESVNVRWAW